MIELACPPENGRVDSKCPTGNAMRQSAPHFARVSKSALTLFTGLCLICLSGNLGCDSRRKTTIAVIPQTEGVVFWDAVHLGAEIAARQGGATVYWNAPTREDDIEAQISLVESVVDRRFQGLLLAPDHSLALISPVRRALSHGIATVVIGSSLPIPPSPNLTNVVNDDQLGGQLAAQRMSSVLHGHAKVAILGVDPDISSTLIRCRAFEKTIAKIAPGISIVEKRQGSYNAPREQQVAEEVMEAHPDLDFIVALMWTSADGVMRALDSQKPRASVKFITFDSPGSPPFDHCANLDSVVQEDIRSMSERGVRIILAKLAHEATPDQVVFVPRLLTRENVNDPQIREMLPVAWQMGNWRWSPIQ